MEHVVVLVAEVGDQLFDLGGRHTFAQEAMLVIRHPLFLDHHALWGERVGVVVAVKLLGVLQVHLEDEALGPVGRLVFDCASQRCTVLYPSKSASRKGLAHGPPVKVVGVKVENVAVWFFRVVSLYCGVVRPGVALRHHRDAAPHPLLDEEVLVVVSEQLQLYSGLFEEGIPRKAWTGVVVRRVQPILFLGSLSKVLKDIDKEQHVGPAVEIGVVA